ncbi:MAG: methenyltetrahydromethanopterin cyclohydrolase [Halobacteriota archaeon]
MLSVNEISMGIVEEMLDYTEELKIEALELDNGSTVIDCGVNVEGGYEAGEMFTEICLGGLGSVRLTVQTLKDTPLVFIHVFTDHPALATLGSQKAGWSIKHEKYSAMGSGPARALSCQPKKTYELIDYEDDYDFGVIALECDRLPDEKVAEVIAEQCNLEPSKLTLLNAPTSSIVGTVQVAGRVVEVAVYKAAELGYDTRKILSAAGSCPIAPVTNDSLRAMGMTNDGIIYYGNVFMTVKDYDEIFERLPSETSSSYGKPFYQTFKEADYDFYKIDKFMFAPAQITITEAQSSKTHKLGRLNEAVLTESFEI